MTLSALGIFSAAGAGGAPTSGFELIESTILTGTQASVSFTGLGTYSSTYKHLQIRALARKDGANGQITFSLNGSGLSYVHALTGTGSSVVSGSQSGDSSFATGLYTPPFAANNFAVQIIDILDVYSTTKNKTLRALSGYVDPVESRINLASALWNNTASLTSITLNSSATNFTAGSRFSIYGIRG